MSHFTVTVCLSADVAKEGHGIGEALDGVLAPFDENMRVEPYRDYEEGAPTEFWWVKSVRSAAEHLRNGTGIKPYDPGLFGYSSDRSKETPDEQRAAFADDAQWAERLGDNPTWAQVVETYNEKYHPNTALAVPGQVDAGEVDEDRLHVDEDGRAYTWSTYNPQSKWDWWVVGGRWQRHFISVPHADPDLLVNGRPGTFGDNGRPTLDSSGALYCDGGPIALLDFGAMRDRAAQDELKLYDRWAEMVAEFGPPEPWERLCSLAELGEISWDEARQRYNGQPIIKAASEGSDPLRGFLGPGPEERFGTTREEFEARARNAAVPGYAMVTTSGEWVAPGRMGWFGMSSDGPDEAAAFKANANRYLDSLPGDTYVVQIDCHI